jgi:hypothetical protein
LRLLTGVVRAFGSLGKKGEQHALKASSCFDGSAVPSEDPLTPAETAKAPKVSESWRGKAHTPAERMRSYRKRRRQGLQYVRIVVYGAAECDESSQTLHASARACARVMGSKWMERK